jgi:hypothetical protein
MILLRPVFLIAIVAVVMIGVMVPNVFAETDDDCSSGFYSDLCKESEYVIWDKNKPLVWNDFQGIPGSSCEDPEEATSEFTACTYSQIDWRVWWEKSNNTPCEYKITKLNVVASIDKNKTWVDLDDTKIRYDDLLKHEQGHFDIRQINAQEFKVGYEGKTFACPSGVYDSDEIFNEIDNHWIEIFEKGNAMQVAYDIETDHHEDREAQAEWDEKIISLLSTDEYVKETSIPFWVKNNAGWWADGTIDDDSFVQGIQFLIKENILKIPSTTQGTSSGNEVPSWVKNNAGWWADGTIDDLTFLSGIEYLVNEGIIVAN